MFYYIVSKLPFINNTDGRLWRTFVLGTMCYLIMHAFIFSKYTENMELLQKYRNYLYYLWGTDLLITGILIKLFNDDADDEMVEKPVGKKMSNTDVNKALSEIKTNIKTDNNEPDIFIKETKKASINNKEESPKKNANKKDSDKKPNNNESDKKTKNDQVVKDDVDNNADKPDIDNASNKHIFSDTEIPKYDKNKMTSYIASQKSILD